MLMTGPTNATSLLAIESIDDIDLTNGMFCFSFECFLSIPLVFSGEPGEQGVRPINDRPGARRGAVAAYSSSSIRMKPVAVSVAMVCVHRGSIPGIPLATLLQLPASSVGASTIL